MDTEAQRHKRETYSKDDSALLLPNTDQTEDGDEQKEHTNSNDAANHTDGGNVCLALGNTTNGDEDNGDDLFEQGQGRAV